MKASPLILITASTQAKGVEFADASLSLSRRYTSAIEAAGGLPLAVPLVNQPETIADYVARAQGVLLTGGDDVGPKLYAKKMPAAIRKTVVPEDPARDLLELLLIEETLRQQKPLLAICRGQQILNVAFGGTLIADIPQQVPGAIKHQRSDAKDKPVHDVQVEADSQLAQLTRTTRLAVNSSHHQSVGKVAAALRVTARADDGIIEALEWRQAGLPFMLAVQFHPERLFDRHPQHLALFTAFVHSCSNGT